MQLHLPDGSYLRIFRLVGQLFGQPIPQPGDGDAHLLHRVAVADGHGVVRLDALLRVANGFKIDGAAIAPAQKKDGCQPPSLCFLFLLLVDCFVRDFQSLSQNDRHIKSGFHKILNNRPDFVRR